MEEEEEVEEKEEEEEEEEKEKLLEKDLHYVLWLNFQGDNKVLSKHKRTPPIF